MSAASANAPSKYNKIELNKEGKEPIELNAGTIAVDYYESLYSPTCLLYTSPSPRDRTRSRMPSSA